MGKCRLQRMTLLGFRDLNTEYPVEQTFEVVLLTKGRDVVSVSEDELKASLTKEAAKVCTEHGLKESPHREYMILTLCPTPNNIHVFM